MKSHRLLLYERISQRMRGKLFWLLLFSLGLGLYDQFTAVLGDNFYILWIAIPAIAILWFYYAILVPRTALQIHPNYLRLRGPLKRINISYGRVHSTTSSHLAQHYPFDQLKRVEQSLLDPYYGETCVFIELRSYPPPFQRRHLWFSRLLFGASRPGLLLVVEDWLLLSRDVESARSRWQEQRSESRQEDRRSLAARVLDE